MHNLFDSIPDHIDSEIIESLIKSGHVRIERIISKGHRSPESGWYDQDNNEWVVVLQGQAVLGFEDEPPLTLRVGDYINIPAGKKHRVDWTDPSLETIWLVVHYS